MIEIRAFLDSSLSYIKLQRGARSLISRNMTAVVIYIRVNHTRLVAHLKMKDEDQNGRYESELDRWMSVLMEEVRRAGTTNFAPILDKMVKPESELGA
jgi:hypothetical protein